MREGILFTGLQEDRIDVRFHGDGCYEDFHCSATMAVLIDDYWIPTCIEFEAMGDI